MGDISAKCLIPIPPNYWNGLVAIIVGVIYYFWLLGANQRRVGESVHLGLDWTEPNLFEMFGACVQEPVYLIKRFIQE
jgi:hypothetical protein